ncbi:MAG: sigma-54-dependent Fis family transcriptional regulator [Bdellovibrio sp.]|nr:MAG: sigma-54-dependent Fis family transcriptional regulator [Bdellovibrio sp.]
MGAKIHAKIHALVADDDAGLRFAIRTALQATGRFDVSEAVDGVEAVEKVREKPIEVAILDVDMPRLSGLEALRAIKEHNPGTIVLVLTAFVSLDSAVQAVKDGAYNYLSKPVLTEDLITVVDRALAAQALISHVAASAPILMEEGRKFIGQTQQMQRVFGLIHRLSKVDTPVLIRGASGTGKELIARAIHFNSSRKEQRFVALNCSAIPESLFESELFGHEKGSFTGADQRKIGKFQFAEGGTLFLDEVGDLPLLMQVKLLRVLQEKVFTPVGSNREIPSNVRIVAATNRPLEEMMQKGSFREDLFYRLNVIPMFLPSLVDRKRDLDQLVQFFIKKFNQLHGKRVSGIAPDALAVLKKYNWPGNIRELENVIEHAFIMEAGHILTLRSLPESILNATGTVLPEFSEETEVGKWNLTDSSAMGETDNPNNIGVRDRDDGESDGQGGEGGEGGSEGGEGGSEGGDAGDDEGLLEEPGGDSPASLFAAPQNSSLDFNAQKEAFEKEFIIRALKAFKGRINQTALHANIPKKTLLRKIEKYGINAREFFI